MEDLAAMAVLEDGPGDLAERVRSLWGEVAALRQEVSRLRREILQLRQEAGYWRSQHAEAVKRNQRLEQQVRELEAPNRQLRQQVFGRRSEQGGTGATDFLQALADREDGSQRRRGQRGDRPGPRRRDYQHLTGTHRDP